MSYQESQGGLLPEALYRPEDSPLHVIRVAQDRGFSSEDARQHMPSATTIARRIKALDPRGLVAQALAIEVEGM